MGAMDSYDRGLADGMRAAAEATCSRCGDGEAVGFAGEGYMGTWRHGGDGWACGAWRIWDEMVRRGMLPEPEGWRCSGLVGGG